MKKLLVLLFVGMIGCGPSSSSGQSPSNAPTASANPTKVTATELYDHYNLGKNMDGAKVEVSGIVRSVDDGRANGKIVLEGGIKPLDMIEVFFEGPISGVSRRDTVTITAIVKGKVKDVLTITDAKLVNSKKKS